MFSFVLEISYENTDSNHLAGVFANSYRIDWGEKHEKKLIRLLIIFHHISNWMCDYFPQCEIHTLKIY